MTSPEIVAALGQRCILGLTLYGEARGEGLDGRAAVGWVIKNRVKAGRFGPDYRSVCLRPFQFSCWGATGGEQNYATTVEAARALVAGAQPSPLLRECLWIADGVIAGDVQDVTHGADHYLTRDLFQSERAPAWSRRMRVTATVGRHVFLASAEATRRRFAGRSVGTG